MKQCVVFKLPKCDFCDDDAAYDARTIHGPWAFVCQHHFDLYGPGELGVGIGQRLVLVPEWCG